MATLEINDENFRQIYQDNDIVILDFWAIWCNPCHQFSPIFEEVSGEFPDIVFGKIETEVEQKLSAYFEIRSIPTIVIIREGLELFRHSGTVGKDDLKMILEKAKTADMAEIQRKVEEEEDSQNRANT